MTGLPLLLLGLIGAEQVIDEFRYANPQVAAATWVASSGTPPVELMTDGQRTVLKVVAPPDPEPVDRKPSVYPTAGDESPQPEPQEDARFQFTLGRAAVGGGAVERWGEPALREEINANGGCARRRPVRTGIRRPAAPGCRARAP